MEHFSIVHALCRSALASPTPAIRKQIERLKEALLDEGSKKDAGRLNQLLTRSANSVEISPTRISRSLFVSPGEALTTSVSPPVDRETSAPLAQIIFPNEVEAAPPIFNEMIRSALDSTLEEWGHWEELSAINVQPAQTCLLYGAPGTGKTRLALSIARQLELPIVMARIDGLVSSFLGTTARNIGNLFAFANRYKCVLLLDEFDAIAKQRDDPQEVGEIKRVVNALLQNLDLRQNRGLTIGITNHPKLLDPAVWRRFEVQLEIPKPDLDARLKITEYFLEPMKVPESHIRLISWFTEGVTGAEIEALVRTYKKSFALNKENPTPLIETLRRFATLNSARISEVKRELLFSSSPKLLKVLKKEDDLKLSNDELGELIGRDKSTISRRLQMADDTET